MSRFASALAELRAGRPIVLPTDTVYGLGALPSAPGAIEAIFAAKRRPETKPIPVLVAKLDDVREVVVVPDAALRLAERFWPGPLTLVLERAPGFDVDLGGDDAKTVAVRIPAHDLVLDLLAQTGPLAVTSANRSGQAPATTVEEARAALGRAVKVWLDGGRCAGTPSTIVSVYPTPRVLREGGIPTELILETVSR